MAHTKRKLNNKVFKIPLELESVSLAISHRFQSAKSLPRLPRNILICPQTLSPPPLSMSDVDRPPAGESRAHEHQPLNSPTTSRGYRL